VCIPSYNFPKLVGDNGLEIAKNGTRNLSVGMYFH
jgi:hypothetical protein